MTKRIIGYVCLVLILSFIWLNSAHNGEDSGKTSGMVAAMLKAVFGETSDLGTFIQQYVRKIGHFVEFGMLGVCSMLLFVYEDKLRVQTIINVLFLGLSVAVIDETIQIFSPGRTSAVRDVWIDVFGFVSLGAVVLVLAGVYRVLCSCGTLHNKR